MKHFTTLLLVASVFFSACSNQPTFSEEDISLDSVPEEVSDSLTEKLWGFDLNEFVVVDGVIKQHEFFSDILGRHYVPYGDIHTLVENARDTFDVRKMNYDKRYKILCSKDSMPRAEYFIYEMDPVNHIVFCLKDSLYAYQVRRPVEMRIRTASGIIQSSLYETMQENDLSPALAMELSDIYAWTIDFYRIQKGDAFKVVFEEEFVDGERIGIGKILAASFNHFGEAYLSYYFEQDGMGNYFDEAGNSLKKAFLKAPLKFSRISSRFQKNRFHPVLKRFKAHLGTDYAAAKGTPIMAVGDGVVIKSEYKSNNGNYVKIKHNGTYETQYLHMSKRAVKVGERVRQGQTIGYVGSTGLATGPHVCFRFWKNGVQVDHLREKFPPSTPINPENTIAFEQVRLDFDRLLNDLSPVKSVAISENVRP